VLLRLRLISWRWYFMYQYSCNKGVNIVDVVVDYAHSGWVTWVE
jgi:hypothetical protein